MTHSLRSTFGMAVVAVLVVACGWGIAGVVQARQPQGHEGHDDHAGNAHDTAATENLPAARELIDRYVEAVGGEKAVRQAKSMTMKGKIDIPAAGISGSLEVRAMAPNKLLVLSEIPGMGTIRDGFDGEVGWSIDPTMGARVKDGAELAQAKFQSDFYGALHTDDRYESMETVEKTDLDGTTCYKVRLVTRDGDEIFEYYDVDSGLVVATEMQAQTPMGAIMVMSRMGDYRQVGALKLPSRMTQSMGPMEQVMEFAEITVDDVDPSVFELPAEIKALTEE